MTDNEFKYLAFLCYSHEDNHEKRADSQAASRLCWGDWLHDALKAFAIPAEFVGQVNSRGEIIPERIEPIFREVPEVPDDASLSADIQKALEQSNCLIVVCSPRSAKSLQVNEAVRYFKQLGRGKHILPIVIAGEPNASTGSKPGISPDEECFVPAMRHPVQPDGTLDITRRADRFIFVDARHGDEKREILADDHRNAEADLEMAKIQLIALLVGVGFNGLWWREQKRHFFDFAEAQHQAREALSQLEAARSQLEEARRETREAQSKALAVQNLPPDVHSQIQEAQSQAHEAQRQLQEFQNQVRDAQNQLEEARTRARTAEDKAREIQTQLEAARQQNSEAQHAQSQLVDTHNQAQDAQNKLLAAQSQIQEFQNQAREALNQVEEVRRQLEEARRETREAQGKALEVQNLPPNVHSQIEEAQNQAREAQKQLQEFQNQIRDTQSQLEEARNRALAAEGKAREVQQQLELETSKQTSEAQNTQSQLAETRHQAQDAQNKLVAAQNQIQEFQNQVRDAQNQLEEARNRAIASEGKAREALNQLESGTKKQTSEAQNTQSQLAETRHQAQDAQNKLVAAQNQVQEFQNQARTIQSQLEETRQQVQKTHDQSRTARRLTKVFALLAVLALLAAGISLRQQQANRRALATATAEASGNFDPLKSDLNQDQIGQLLQNIGGAEQDGNRRRSLDQLAASIPPAQIPGALKASAAIVNDQQRSHFQKWLLIRLGWADPASAMACASAIDGKIVDDEGLTNSSSYFQLAVLDNWMKTDLRGALRWVGQVPDTASRQPALGAILNWVKSQPDSDSKSKALETCIAELANTDAPGALALTESLPDTAWRSLAIARLWMITDPFVAWEWVNNLDVPTETVIPRNAPPPWIKLLLN